MEIFVSKENLNDIEWLRKQLDAIKKEIEKEKSKSEIDHQRLKELQEMEKRIGYRYEWLIKPI